jgi:hypothetical protein
MDDVLEIVAGHGDNIWLVIPTWKDELFQRGRRSRERGAGSLKPEAESRKPGVGSLEPGSDGCRWVENPSAASELSVLPAP